MKSGKGIGKQPKGIKTLKDKRQHGGKGNKHIKTLGNSMRSHSSIGIQNELLCLLNLDACVDFLCSTFV